MIKKIWIDLDNTPHVLLFAPIIDELENRGLQVFVTIRDCFQVKDISDLYGLRYTIIGKHSGKNKILKILGLFYRAIQFLPFILEYKPTFALSHGSRAQLIISKVFGIKSLLLFDYEYAKILPFFKPNYFLAPEVIGNNVLVNNKFIVNSYPGIKENIYIPFFSPDEDFYHKLNIDPQKILITIRPPADEAHYHNPESELFFEMIIERILHISNILLLILPRNNKQKATIIKRWEKPFKDRKFFFTENAINGLDIVYYSDIVISGGGTMIREAVALETPAFSFFKGEIGLVDKYLNSIDKLKFIDNECDVNNICFTKKTKLKLDDNKHTFYAVVDKIIEIANF